MTYINGIPTLEYTVSELQLLENFIRSSGSITGMWSEMDFYFLKSINGFSRFVHTEPWRKTVLNIHFRDLPLYVNSGRGLYDNLWYEQIWGTPVIKWRLQIGK